MALLAFALLADGRFPAGGHVHSAGVEAAITDGRVVGMPELEEFLVGRLHSGARAEAALAAAAGLRLAGDPPEVAVLRALDAEAEARITPPLRAASRRLGRQLVRAATPCWPSTALARLAGAFPAGTHQPVALGAVATSAGLEPVDAARLALHHAVTTAVQAAVRLLGLDPFAVAALTARVGAAAEAVAAEVTALAAGPLADLPATTGPIVDVAAAEHAARDGALFVT